MLWRLRWWLRAWGEWRHELRRRWWLSRLSRWWTRGRRAMNRNVIRISWDEERKDRS